MLFRNIDNFLTIVETGSLTKAAEKLYISQPSLSQYLKRLENRLGVELFDRNTSPLQLTYTGERFYEYARQAKRLNENALREFQDIGSQTSGRLRLGVALWRCACLLPDVFPSFHSKYPNIRLELTEGRAIHLETALKNDQIDLAVMNLPRSMDYSRLSVEIIMEERILLVAPTKHPYVQRCLESQIIKDAYPVVGLDILKHIPLVLTKPGQNLTHEVRHALGKAHIEPNILLDTGNLTTAINLAAQGMCCAFVPEEGAKVCQRSGDITFFSVDSPSLVWDLAAVYRNDTYLPHLARLFIDTAKAELKPPHIS